jgi:hypothetical protein
MGCSPPLRHAIRNLLPTRIPNARRSFHVISTEADVNGQAAPAATHRSRAAGMKK